MFYRIALWWACPSPSRPAWNNMHDDVRAGCMEPRWMQRWYIAGFSSRHAEEWACLHSYWSPDFLIHFHIMGSTDLISQRRGWVITCHFNNVFYCLQALVVPNKSNGGFYAKWNGERGIGSRQRRRRVKRDWILRTWLNFIRHALSFFAVSCGGFCWRFAGWPTLSRLQELCKFSRWTQSQVYLATWGEFLTVLSERRIDSFGLGWKKNQTFWTISQERQICSFAGLKTWRLQWGCL